MTLTIFGLSIQLKIQYLRDELFSELAHARDRYSHGAGCADVLRLVVRQGMTMTFIGLALGLIAAFFMSRVLVGLLYGVSAKDPLTFAGVSDSCW